MSQVRDILQLSLGDFSLGMGTIAKLLDDFVAQPMPDLLVTSHIEENRTQQTSRGITASKKDIQHIVSQHLRIRRLCRQRLRKDIPASRLFLLRVLLGLQGQFHIVVNDLVHALVGVLEFLGVDQPVRILGPRPRRQVILRRAKCLRKALRIPD